MKNTLILLAMLTALLARPTFGLITEPDKVLYGTITLNGRAVTAFDGYRTNDVSRYRVEVRRGSTVLGTYVMGSRTNYHPYFYGLRITLEAYAPVEDAQTKTLDTLTVVLKDGTNELVQQTHQIVERAETRLDFGGVADSDGDGVSDLDEFDRYGTDPLSTDTDGDGLNDGFEVRNGIDPLSQNSDGDRAGDGREVPSFTDPLNSNSFVVALSGTVAYAGPQTGAVRVCVAPGHELNRVLALDGAGDCVAVQGGAMTTAGQLSGLTAEAWVKTTAAGLNTVAGWDRAAGWRLSVGDTRLGGYSGFVGFDTTDSAGNTHDMKGQTAVNDGQWHHVAATFDSATGDKTIYVDGFIDAVQTNAHAAGLGLGAGTTRYGFIGVDSLANTFNGQKDTATFFNGRMDDVRLWTRALPASEILSNALSLVDASAPGLTAAWDFDDSTATPVGTNGVDGAMQDNAATTAATVFVRTATIAAPGPYAVTNVPNRRPMWVTGWRDSNGNGLRDSWEASGTCPLCPVVPLDDLAGLDLTLVDPDTDGDGLTDYEELFVYGTNPNSSDTDGDGLTDWQEVHVTLTNPTKADTDGDGLSDGQEVNVHHTNPLSMDTDSDGYSDGWEVALGNDPTNPADRPRNPRNDFDRDGKSDLGFYNAPDGLWRILRSTAGTNVIQFGFNGTIPVSADYDGDGYVDVGLYHPPSGNWYIFKSRDGFMTIQFGFENTVPVAGDFDGDNQTDLGVYWPSGGQWYIFKSREGFFTTQFGYRGTQPLVGDFDGDRKADMGIYDPATGQWYFFQSSAGFKTKVFKYPGTAVCGDYDGDGKSDVGFFDADSARWNLDLSSAGPITVTYGGRGTTPVVGDYDGDGRDDLGVYSGADRLWHIYRSGSGEWSSTFSWNGKPLGSP